MRISDDNNLHKFVDVLVFGAGITGACTALGPLVNRKQAERVLSYITSVQEESASLKTGGKIRSLGNFSLYVEPTIFDDVTNQMKNAREEIFGPVLSVITFETEDEAIQIANDTPYGLAASLWTDNLARVHRVSRKLRAGSVSVNTADSYSPAAPHVGYRESGIGRDLSIHALDNYTQLKTTWFDLN